MLSRRLLPTLLPLPRRISTAPTLSAVAPRLLPATLLPPRRISTTPTLSTTAPPLLLTLRTDLKSAMRAKDQTQLAVLRLLLAEITNASKTPAPPRDDLDILQIVNKARARARTSVDEFREAGRADLAEKEEAQLTLLDEYAALVDTVDAGEIRAVAEKVVERLEGGGGGGGGGVNVGAVMKAVLAELEGEPVVKSVVAAVVKDVVKGGVGSAKQ